jgi:anhydro-N-acetylmuramic acid kinase
MANSSIKKHNYSVIGIMSGTSLDGLDIAYVHFIFENNTWLYKIEEATTIAYDVNTRDKLKNAPLLNGIDLIQLHTSYGHYIGKTIRSFLKNKHLNIDFICSHGHTIFHQPNKGFTFQLGNGASIVSETGITTICDFRSLDVALKGTGAPLVPIGDELLFSDYDTCLNLGGFANISYKSEGKRIAYDICPVNIIINKLVEPLGKTFDKNGALASTGVIIPNLLNDLNNCAYYKIAPPKSLAREWLEKEFNPILNNYNHKVEDKLRTIYEHIAIQIAKNLKGNKILSTGGGTHNKYLIQLIEQHFNHPISIPDELLIDFKEALIFGLLGVLRFTNQTNCLSSVTGATKNCIGGAIYVGS